MARFTPENAAAMAAKRIRKGRKNRVSDIIAIQALLLVDIKKETTLPHIRAQCARAYDVLEERIRILTGKPLPGQLRPDLRLERAQYRKKGKQPATPLPLPELDRTEEPKAEASRLEGAA